MTDPGQVVEALMAALETEYGDALVTASGVSWLSVHHVPIRRLVTRLVRQLLELDEVPTTTVFGAAEDLVVAGGSTSLGYVAYEVSEAGLSFLLGHGEPGQLTPDSGELAVPVQPRLTVTTAPVCAVSWSSRHAETLLPVLSDLACQGVRSTVVDMASEVNQRFPDTSEPGITVLRLPDEALDRHGDVPAQSAVRPESERTVRAGQYEIGIGRLAWLAARVLVRSAGCTQPSWSATLYVEQWLDAVLLASRSRVLLCSNDTSPLGVLAIRAAERAAADTVYVQHGAWIEGQTSSHAQRCRHVAVMGARDVRVAQAGTRRADARTYVVGQPRFDGLTQVDRLGQRAYLQRILKEQTGSAPTRIVVWACQPFSEQRLLGQTEVLVEGLRNAKGGWGLVVAPHPAQNAETLSPLLDVLNGVPVALIGSEVGARGCLAGGDALISASSTCGIEALLLEVPVLELALPATRTLGLADHGAAWRCESSRDIARFLTRIDESPQTVRVPTAARESICHWDGRSADAVADIVTQALSDSTTPHHSAQGTDRRMTNTFTGDSVAELFIGAVMLAKSGDKISPRGMATREVFDVNMTLTQPRARLLYAPPARILNPAFAVAETVWHLSGTDAPWIYGYNEQLRQYADDGILQGAYGPRMRNWAGKVDQLHRVVEILKADPDSRRALIQLYDPARDTAGHKDVPCTLGFRFHLRAGRLHMSTTMRGQDVWIGLPYDLFFFTTLHELVAGWLDAELGEYHHHVSSLHIYERDLDRADGLTDVAASPLMPELTTPWEGFDELLGRVEARAETGHPGWDSMAETMCSYRLWKDGMREEAWRVADAVDGPIGEALTAWYGELTCRTGTSAAQAAAGTR